MSDENDNLETAIADESADGPMGGERLAQARRELQIPVIEIAKELHLDEYKVRALESNDFDVIGAPVFAKGHLRKYAQLVKVDEADVMADYYQLNRSVSTPLVISVGIRPRRNLSPGPWIAAATVVAIVAFAYWWFTTRDVAPPRPVTGVVAALPDDVATNEPEDEDVEDEGPATAVDVEPAIVTEAESLPPPAITLDTAGMQLSITYSGDCWTEITDASGRRLFFELGRSGRTVNLSGEAPFNVLFGDAANVSLVVNGANFNIPATNRRGRTARLTITGP
jgi:cytoskeleton protein RodZ